jgi:hypothetical protein
MVTGGDAILTEGTISGASATEQAHISVYISLLPIVKDNSFDKPCKWESDFRPHLQN